MENLNALFSGCHASDTEHYNLLHLQIKKFLTGLSFTFSRSLAIKDRKALLRWQQLAGGFKHYKITNIGMHTKMRGI